MDSHPRLALSRQYLLCLKTVASPSPSLSPGFSPLISPSNAKGPASPAESPSSSPLLTATHPPLPSSLQMAPSPTLVPTNVSQPSQPTSHNQSQYPSQPPTISSTNQSSQPTQAGTQLYPPKGISGTSPSLPEQVIVLLENYFHFMQKELRREQSKQDGSVHSSQQGSQKQVSFQSIKAIKPKSLPLISFSGRHLTRESFWGPRTGHPFSASYEWYRIELNAS